MNIRISSDSTCDLAPATVAERSISLFAMSVVKDGVSYRDNVTITPAEIFAHVASGGALCSTSAGSVGEYEEYFTRLTADGSAVIHVSLGSGFSSTYQNACLAAAEVGNVYVVDSQNLSTGQGHVVLKACELSKTMDDPGAIQAELQAYTEKVEASFLLDQLTYMVKGGRCSSVVALGANLLNLKPCIEVRGGKMSVTKKYRGTYAKCLASYVKDRLAGREDLVYDRLFLTYTTVTDPCRTAVLDAIGQYGSEFAELCETTAGCTISCHCGPNTLGILFVRK